MIRNPEHFREYTTVSIIEIIELLKKMLEGSSGGGSSTGGIEDISTNTDAIKTNTDTLVTLLTQINSKMKTILVVTQAEYDLIDPKDPNTIYLITQDTEP